MFHNLTLLMLAVKTLSFFYFIGHCHVVLIQITCEIYLHLCEVLKGSLQKLSDGLFLLVWPVRLADCVYSRRRKI